MADLKTWSTNASDNSQTSPDGANSGWTGSQVGPWARETMASVAEWYKDPAWVNPMENIADLGDKTVTRSGDNQITVESNTGGSISTVATDHFPTGRMIRLTVSGGGSKIHAFVISSTVSNGDLILTLALLNQDSITGGTEFESNGIEVYGAQSAETSVNDHQALGVISFSGIGTTTERNSRFPMSLSLYPDGLLWFDTTTDLMQVKRGGSWLDFATFDDRLEDHGRVLRVEANDTSTYGDASIHLLSRRGSTAQLRGYERNEADDGWNTAGILYFDDAGASIILESARKDSDGLYGDFARIAAYGAGHETRAGELRYIKYSHVSETSSAIDNSATVSLSLTPGELDAGTLNDKTALQIITEKNYQWDMTGDKHPGEANVAASFTTSPSSSTYNTELVRFAFPSELIAALGVGNTVDITIDLALDGYSSVGGGAASSPDDIAMQYANAAFFFGDNFGDPSDSICSGWPTSGTGLGSGEVRKEFDRPSLTSGWGIDNGVDPDLYGIDARTVNNVTVTSNLGCAIAIRRYGASSAYYYRCVPTTQYNNTRFLFSVVKDKTVTNAAWVSEAQ